MQEESHLDAENIHEDTDRKNVDFFTCPICLRIVRDPKQCAECDTLFCHTCIVDWTQQEGHNYCPKKCSEDDFQIIKVNRFVKQTLDELRYHCPYPSCKQVHDYRKALTHLADCAKLPQPCTNECGLFFYADDIEQHVHMQCEKTVLVCESCEEKVKPYS